MKTKLLTTKRLNLHFKQMTMYQFIKSVLDFIVAISFCILISPILIVIMIAVIIESPGSPFFFQKRLGKDLKIFRICKFRTMMKNAESKGTGIFTNANDPRITQVGHILRKYSLDEIPQVFNIILGEMSFVGPRPPVEYHPYKAENYPKEFIPRFSIKPGITGLAQISGRTNLSWPERFEFDIIYLSNYSFFEDLKILFLTFLKIFKNETVYPTDSFREKNHKKI